MHHSNKLLTQILTLVLGSASSFLTPPFYGVYASTKVALETINDALRIELNQFNVSVSLLQPGSTSTEIEGKMLAQAKAIIEDDSQIDYAPRMFRMSHALEWLSGYPPLAHLLFTDVKYTTQAIVDALESERPKTKYIVGWDAEVFKFAVFLPDR